MNQVRRRQLLLTVAAFLSASLGRAQQQGGLPVIGFLHPGSPESYAEFVASFRQGLNEAGYVERKNVVIEYRWADGQYDRLPRLAAELVGRRVGVIVTAGATAAVLAAKAATSTIPIVFAIGADPVRFGLVASFNRPGGNVTGVSFMANVLVSKQLELLREVVPTATTIGALVNPSNPNAKPDIEELKAAANSIGRKLHIVYARNQGDLDAAFASLAQLRTVALLIFPDPLFSNRLEQLVALAARHKVAAIYGNRVFPEAGGLLSYGSSQSDAYRQIGIYAARILRGEKPADLPVLQPTKFELVVNSKTAKALGIAIPQSILLRADLMIE